MKQTEVETKLVEIKSKWASKINELASLKNDIKEQRMNLGREVAEKQKELKRLYQQEHFFGMQVFEMQAKRRDEVSKFKMEHYSGERKLGEVSDWCLVNELVARGFTGTINNDAKPDDFMQKLQQRFAGGVF